MFWMLAWVACTGGAGEKADKGAAPDHDRHGGSEVVEKRPVPLPDGEPVVRSCFGAEEEAEKKVAKPNRGPVPPPVASGATKLRQRLFPGASAPESAPAEAPAPTATPSAAETTASASPPADGAPMAATGGSMGGIGQGEGGASSSGVLGALKDDAASPEPMAPRSKPKTSSKGSRANDEGDALAGGRTVAKREEAKERLANRPPPKPPQPQVDWGGTTWLSNDDSMSLASAQRVLFDVKEHVNFGPSEVRPHELLNYFSFESEPVEEGKLFSVKPSASRTGDEQITLALAVQGATPPRQPLDLTLVVDVSGSMWAEGRMDYVKRGLHRMSEQLERGDRVNLVVFDDKVCTPLENYVVGRDPTGVLANAIDTLVPRGSTDLNLGLHEGYRLAGVFAAQDASGDRNDRVMVLTDALLNTGDVNPDTITEIAKAYEQSGVRLTGVGVGREFNDEVLDKLTEKGKGAYVYLGSEAVVDRIMGVGFRSLTQTIAHDVRFELDLPESLGLSRFYGEEASSDPEDIQPINYYAGTRQLFLQDLRLRDGRVVSEDPIALTIHYKDARTGETKTQRFTTTVGQALASDTHNVEKARALMAWTDFLLARALHGEPCGSPLAEYRSRISGLGDDAEIAYVNSLTGPLCGVDLGGPVAGGGVAWRVRVDSDVPIAEVALSCPSGEQRQSLSGADTVARFNATPGSCTLTLEGAVPLIAKVEVPSTGGEARCLVRGGRLSCS